MGRQVIAPAAEGDLRPMVGKIDYVRGVTIRRHGSTGIEVIMYKDAPGEYINRHGTPVSEKMAAEAGFNVKQLAALKAKRERMSAAGKLIEAEFAKATQANQVVAERAGFTVVDLGGDRYTLRDPDGNPMGRVILTKEQAMGVLEQIAPEEDVATA